MLQRKSKPMCGNDATTTTKVAKPAKKSTGLSRFAFGGAQKTNKRKLVDLASESSDDGERVEVDWKNVEADRLQEAMMGEFDSGESDESSMSELEEEEMDEEAQRRERERCLLEAVGAMLCA